LGVVGWNALIDGYCKVQDMAAALAVVERMTTQGLALDVVGYNTLVAGFCHSGDADAAWEVAERMKADGVEPSVVTHTALIGEYCKMKRIEEAFTLYEGMVRSGVLPDVVTLSALVDGLMASAGIAGSQRHIHFLGMCRMMMLFYNHLRMFHRHSCKHILFLSVICSHIFLCKIHIHVDYALLCLTMIHVMIFAAVLFGSSS
jgi:pentatricopeptide repeat protein